MKLNLDATDEEIQESLEKEKKLDWLKYILGFAVIVIIGGGIWAYFSYSNAQAEAARQKEVKKIETLKQDGVPVAGEIINAWQRISRGSVVGYEVEYKFIVQGQTYKGKGDLRNNPQSPFGGFNDIRVIYDPKEPTNNLTSTDLDNFNQYSSSNTSSATANDYKWLIKFIVIAVIGILFSGVSFLFNKISDLFNRNF